METDRNGIPFSSYPTTNGSARLLGLTSQGVAAYHEDDVVYFAELDDNEDLVIPPPDFGIANEVDLEGFEWSISEYLVESISEDSWNTLSDYAEDILNQSGVDIGEV